MKVKNLYNITCLTPLNENVSLEKDIKELYSGDLFSWVMGHVKEENTLLLTILSSMNAVAVATLLDMSAIIFCDGVIPDNEIIKKATEENIPLFSSNLSTIKTALEIKQYESSL